jgi:suppressor for copper-sensitivity B
MQFARGLALALVAVLVGSAGLGPSHAQEGPWAAAEAVQARLLSAVTAVGELDPIPAGLHVRLADGWKTYWRSPGAAGLPPRLDWSGSVNVEEVGFRWPAPQRFELFGFDNFGYEKEVVFPLDVTPARVGEPVALRGRANLLVCSSICVPTTLDVALDLPAGSATTAPGPANLIGRFVARVPGSGEVAGLDLVSVASIERRGGAVLRLEATARQPWDVPDIVIETGEGVAFAAPEITYRDGRTRLIAELAPYDADLLAAAALPVTVTIVDGDRLMERSATVQPYLGGDSDTATVNLIVILGFALLGGLILNVMPCVLPVLSLKLLSIVSHRGSSRRDVRLRFLASAAGILFTFFVLAGALIALKTAGGTIGWGIQFQQPLFLVFMVVLLTLFACNLLSVFEIRLPTRVAVWAGDTGQGAGLKGHFAAGAFATLLATPCSAPFLGTAVGFALARGTTEILLVFTALGIGLAMPYLLVAAFPAAAALLPRPGRWMIVLRRILSLALVLTAVWLLSILAVQTSITAALVVGGLALAIGLILWARGFAYGRARLASSALASLIAVAAFVVPLQIERQAPEPAPQAFSDWRPFDRGEIDRLVLDGQTVFVDVTADWCITCKANKALVINRGEVAERLRGDDVVAMQGDWTLPDERISTYLAGYGRYGLPFNAVYGPGAPEGIVLPELLTEAAVLEALARARTTPKVGVR